MYRRYLYNQLPYYRKLTIHFINADFKNSR